MKKKTKKEQYLETNSFDLFETHQYYSKTTKKKIKYAIENFVQRKTKKKSRVKCLSTFFEIIKKKCDQKINKKN